MFALRKRFTNQKRGDVPNHRLILTSGDKLEITNEEQQKLVELIRQQNSPYRLTTVNVLPSGTPVLVMIASIAAIEPE
jgi:hypothetical protein